MPRKKRPLDRQSGTLRDASLIIIASEDRYAVESYFRRFSVTRVQFKVLPTLDGNSSPRATVERLDRFRRETETEDGDEFWICIDLDHWAEADHIQNLREVAQLCRQKNYAIAINHPCIELWFLLHFTDFVPPPQDQPLRCAEAIRQLAAACGKMYRKGKCRELSLTVEQVHAAVDRAKLLDQGTGEIPSSPVARIYRILERLQQRDSITLR